MTKVEIEKGATVKPIKSSPEKKKALPNKQKLLWDIFIMKEKN